MFDVTPDDIKLLSDADLRELVGRLCEAELMTRGLSPVAVTWGGDQNAPDGGLDVRVSLPPDALPGGVIPRAATGFQVKKPDMPREKIIDEMRPGGALRPVIQELANQSGAYLIVSSKASTADSALRRRTSAMREALDGAANADDLYTDFFDSTRLATWTRCHAGLVAWVRARVGRALAGWQPYGPWAGTAEPVDAEYLVDDTLRLHLGRRRDSARESIADAIDELRDTLSKPGAVVRLVGLSGVGKTRFVQALFDSRVGARALSPSLAVYTNLSDNPDPQPTGIASDLIANASRAVLIVDNCPPELHRRLSELCVGETSTVSVLTVEYDVRDDQPEGTHVVTLDTSSPDLIEKLVRRRHQHISQVDARTIATASGGNARIAMALADTVERSDSIAGLSNDELFQRLFRQRQDPNNRLLLAAQACSLVYSFQGVELTGDDAEIPRLAQLAEQPPTEVYRHVVELLRRDLVQQRGPWRAVLPHAIANYLAARALDDIPFDLINQCLVEGGTARLAKSFSRRLSFLHSHPQAVAIVERWLAPGGYLDDVANFNDLGRSMFSNVAPVLPGATLGALERVAKSNAAMDWREYLQLLRSLAYDPPLFARSAELLVNASVSGTDEKLAKEAADTFASLFTIFLSGTHATVAQRVEVIESLLSSSDSKRATLGLAALDEMLTTTHFSSSYAFDFGAHSRDFGYEPHSRADAVEWFGSALALAKRVAAQRDDLAPSIRDLVATNFRGLWSAAKMHDELDALMLTFAKGGFWREGWAACRQTMYFDKDDMGEEEAARLLALEAVMKPCTLGDRVKSVVIGGRFAGLDLDDMEVDEEPVTAAERLGALANELGALAYNDTEAFDALLPDLLRGGQRVWAFGRGLAAASTEPGATWSRLVSGFESMPIDERNAEILRGFLNGLWSERQTLAQQLLDDALARASLVPFLPALQAAVTLDDRGIERLSCALVGGTVPVRAFLSLAWGGTSAHATPAKLRDLVLQIADQDDGYFVAIDILYMRLHSDNSAKQEHDPCIIDAGRQLLQRIPFAKANNPRGDHELAGVAKGCLLGPSGRSVAAEVTASLRRAVAAYETYAISNDDLLEALLEVHPEAVLDGLFGDKEIDPDAGVEMFERVFEHRRSLADVIPDSELLEWCDANAEHRYPLVARFVSFAAGTPLAWSDAAKTLLARSPDPEQVLSVFIKRFRPTSWSGSRAALMEANAQLLDQVASLVPPRLEAFVAEARQRLAHAVAQEREWETKRDQERDERFE